MALTPAERSMQRRLAVHSSWAKTEDRTGRTEPARKAAFARFEKLVDPTVCWPQRSAPTRHQRPPGPHAPDDAGRCEGQRLRKQAARVEAGLAAEDPELVAGAAELADNDAE